MESANWGGGGESVVTLFTITRLRLRLWNPLLDLQDMKLSLFAQAVSFGGRL